MQIYVNYSDKLFDLNDLSEFSFFYLFMSQNCNQIVSNHSIFIFCLYLCASLVKSKKVDVIYWLTH